MAGMVRSLWSGGWAGCLGGVAAIVVGAGMLLLSGCGDFFTKDSGGGGGGSTGSYTYVGTQGGQLGSYAVSSAGALTALAGSPSSLATSAINALVVTSANANLYAAVAGSGVFGLHINSGTGVPTLISNSALTTDVSPLALTVDPGGTHLLVAGLANGGPAVGIYNINSDGTLSELTGSPVALTFPQGTDLTTLLVQQIAVAPNSSYVFVSLGQLGVAPLPFNTGGNLSANAVLINPRTSSVGGSNVANQDLGLAVDATSGFLFVGETNQGIRVFSVGASNAFTEISGSPFPSGGQPHSLAFDGTGAHLYSANAADNTISGYSVATTGALTAITGSPFSSVGAQPFNLALDQSKTFLIAADLGGNPNVQLFSFDATTAGKLNPGATVTNLQQAAAVASTR
jgi:6-phosphogluconolactonase